MQIIFLYKELQIDIFKTYEHPKIATTLAYIGQQWSNLCEYEKALRQFNRVIGESVII